MLSGSVTIEELDVRRQQCRWLAAAHLDNAGGTVSLINSTFTANSAQEGGGIDNLADAQSDQLHRRR